MRRRAKLVGCFKSCPVLGRTKCIIIRVSNTLYVSPLAPDVFGHSKTWTTTRAADIQMVGNSQVQSNSCPPQRDVSTVVGHQEVLRLLPMSLNFHRNRRGYQGRKSPGRPPVFYSASCVLIRRLAENCDVIIKSCFVSGGTVLRSCTFVIMHTQTEYFFFHHHHHHHRYYLLLLLLLLYGLCKWTA